MAALALRLHPSQSNQTWLPLALSPSPSWGLPLPFSPQSPPKSPFYILQSHIPPFQSCSKSVSFLYFKPNFGFFLSLYTPPSGKSFEYPVTPQMNIQFEYPPEYPPPIFVPFPHLCQSSVSSPFQCHSNTLRTTFKPSPETSHLTR